MRPALPGELYEIFALPGVLYENLALITGHCMEYTLACIWCHYYDDGLEVSIQYMYSTACLYEAVMYVTIQTFLSHLVFSIR